MAEAFLGPREPGQHVNHIDGNKTNNNLLNLEYLPAAANRAHAMANGLMCQKLSLQDVRDIQAARASGVSGKELAARYGVSQSSICIAYRGRRRTT